MTEWKTIPGASHYQVSDEGDVCSVDRTVGGRRYTGVVLKTRVSNRGYVLVNIRTDDGQVQTRTVHTLVLEAFVGPCPPGMEACHEDDNDLNNRLSNLRWDTHGHNEQDKYTSGRHPKPVPPPRPKPRCILCDGVVDRGGRRCHACVVGIGEEAAALLASGVTLTEAMRRLDYPSAEGLHTLAVKYGGYGKAPEHTASWLRRVMGRVAATLRGRPRGGDAR